MKKFLAFLLLTVAAFGQTLNQVKQSQMTNVIPPAYVDRFIVPTANSLSGYDSLLHPVNVTIGAGLTLSGNVLSATTAGTVLSFSAGNLSPLFTTSVATSTTTPALSFSLINAAQNSVLAGPTSGTGAPSYRALVAADIPALAYEPSLGNPGVNGYVLSSTMLGVRSWVAQPASLPPSGSASGDLSGSYPGPTVSGLLTKALPALSTTALLRYNGSAWAWDTSAYITGNQTITLSGDVTGSGATSISATVGKLNGTSLAGLTTGILMNTTGTGVPSIVGYTGGSLSLSSGNLILSGDAATPGNSYFYGTNGAGTKGWYTLAGAGVTSIAGTANEITASASVGAVTLSLPSALTFTGKTVTGGSFTGGSLSALTGLGIRSTGAAYDVTIASNEVLTAGRTLSLVLGNAARTLSLGGNLTTAGAFTTSGAYGVTITATNTTSVTLPTSGTLLSSTNAANTTTTNLDSITATASTDLTLAAGTTNRSVHINPSGTGNVQFYASGPTLTWTSGSNTTVQMPAGEDIDFALGSGGDTIKFLSNTGGSGQVRLSPRGWNNAAAATTQLNFNTSRGTVSSALPNNSGDILTQIAFSGGTGTGTTAYYNGATIKVAATENYSSTAGGTNISFWTTPNTTHVIQNSVQIENTGVLTAYYGIYSYGTFTLNAGTRTSGTAAYFYVSAAADTGITANTESIGANWVTATRTWADGTVAIQREHLIAAPTYNKTTTAATFTKAATFAITAAPIAGTGVTITNPYALWVQAGLTQLDGGVNVTGTIVASSTLKTAAGVTWDFGALTTATVSLDTTRYLAVTVGGVAYKVLVAP